MVPATLFSFLLRFKNKNPCKFLLTFSKAWCLTLGWTVARLKKKILTEKKIQQHIIYYVVVLQFCNGISLMHVSYLINMLRCDIYGLDMSLTSAWWARLKVNYNVLSKHNGKYLKGCTFVIANKSWCGHADMCLQSVDLYYRRFSDNTDFLGIENTVLSETV